MKEKTFLDTSALLNAQNLDFYKPFVISYISLKELENIKTSASKDQDIKYKARSVVKYLEANEDKYEVCFGGKDQCIKLGFDVTNDNIILGGAYFTNNLSPTVFYTDDLLLKLCGGSIGLNVRRTRDDFINDKEYCGYKEVDLSDEEMAYFYENLGENKFECKRNMYLLIKDLSGEVVDKRKWNGISHVPISYKPVPKDFVDRVVPINLQQELAFDLLQDRNSTIKVLGGAFGSGKDLLMISNALNLIKNNKFKKIIWVRNNIEVKNTKPIGFLPGSYIDKLVPYAMPLCDHIGGKDGLEMLMMQGKIELEHLGLLRGRNFEDSIVYCSEAENMSKEHIQLLLGRIARGSELWLNGDCRQVDENTFETNNGLKRAINKLQGNPKFGFVKLQKVERSATAQLADLLD